MAKRVRIKINSAGVRELLNSQEVADDLRTRADRIAAAAGDGFEVLDSPSDRVGMVVVTGDTDSRRAEAEDRALTRAIDAGR